MKKKKNIKIIVCEYNEDRDKEWNVQVFETYDIVLKGDDF